MQISIDKSMTEKSLSFVILLEIYNNDHPSNDFYLTDREIISNHNLYNKMRLYRMCDT